MVQVSRATVGEHTPGTRVLIVDDDPLVLSSLRSYFATTEDIYVVAEARDGLEALTTLDSLSVDLVLADIHMPTMDGVTLLHEIQRRREPPAFVAITALDTDSTMLEVLAGGGAGYIIKSSRPQAIITAVRDATAGGTAISPQALRRLVGYISDRPTTPKSPIKESSTTYDSLTDIEKRVLEHLCKGMSNAEIAKTMNYSESTVKKHVSKLISDFNVTSRLSLAVTVISSSSRNL